MTLFFHELKRDRVKLIVWAAAIASMLLISLVIYPQMTSQMGEMGDMFAQMGGFTQAFNMDKVNFGEFSGYFAVECGNVLGLGGAFFASLLGIAALAKEERERTAEFLLTHPVSRIYVVAQKLLAVIAQILILNVVVSLTAVAGSLIIGEKIDAKLFCQVFLGYLLMQLEIGCVMFGLSAFLRGSGLGIALGVSFVLYFMNILANLTDDAAFLRYITPFSYADSTAIVSNGAIEVKYLIPGILYTVAGVAAAFLRYGKKDIRA
ncbi:MAG: ABC transporter permease subunit [Oscillospiraceae bacterium]|nr:ABC transporter permease subunit [Oscillospiraceae bacterium]